jgi:hypothetical protein
MILTCRIPLLFAFFLSDFIIKYDCPTAAQFDAFDTNICIRYYSTFMHIHGIILIIWYLYFDAAPG